jgi:MYND finger
VFEQICSAGRVARTLARSSASYLRSQLSDIIASVSRLPSGYGSCARADRTPGSAHSRAFYLFDGRVVPSCFRIVAVASNQAMPSCSSKGGKSKKRKPKPIDEEEEKELANAFAASSLGQITGITDETLAASAAGVPDEVYDNPPCDGCAKPFVGTMQCGQCQSVFYCCRDCQVSHWTSEHKAECAELKHQNEVTATQALQSFEETRGWSDLDFTSAYKAAVRLGLHDKIREVLELDKTSIVSRCRGDGEFICYTDHVMKVLFRGQRAEGKNSSGFSDLDGLRIKGYVRSHPDAFDTWLQASVKLIHAVLDRTTLMRNPLTHIAVHNAAHDVWQKWVLVFTSPVASRAILTPFPTTGCVDAISTSASGELVAAAAQRPKMCEDRARRIVFTLRDVIRLLNSVSDPRFDPDNKLASGVCFTAAAVHFRLQAFRIGVDAEAIYNLKDLKRTLKFGYLCIAPLAKTIHREGQHAELPRDERGHGPSLWAGAPLTCARKRCCNGR